MADRLYQIKTDPLAVKTGDGVGSAAYSQEITFRPYTLMYQAKADPISVVVHLNLLAFAAGSVRFVRSQSTVGY